jgi:hypothetical protein
LKVERGIENDRDNTLVGSIFCNGEQCHFCYGAYGESGEKLTITAQDGTVLRMLPVVVLGKTFNFRVETDEEFNALPPAGVLLMLQGILRRRRNSMEGLSGQLEQLTYEGKPKWRPPTEADFLSGLRFEGFGIVSRKRTGTYQGREFFNVQVASWGSTFVFKEFASGVFDRIEDESQSYFAGRLDSKVVNSGDFVTDELVPEVVDYRVFPGAKAGDPKATDKPAA